MAHDRTQAEIEEMETALDLERDDMRGPTGECPHCGKIDCRCGTFDVGGPGI